jgi:L-fuconolactonase
MTIDAHQHFWKFDPVRHSWIDDNMRILQRDFLPEELGQVLNQNGVDGCIAVQADQSEAETHFLLELADANDFIRGVTGWVDLQATNLSDRLDHFAQFPKLKGFRHILQGEKPEFMLQPNFIHGLQELGRRGLTFDILIFPKHLSAVKILLKNCCNQPFVLDHMAKPYIRRGLIRQWEKDLRVLARHENLCCKVSGLVTEANWATWKQGDFRPYLEVAFEAFGSQRLIYGSDWPVCLVAAAYAAQKGILENYLNQFSSSEQAGFWWKNAARFFGV